MPIVKPLPAPNPPRPGSAVRAATLALVGLAGGCLAHYPRPDEPVEFMERTHVGHAVDAGQIGEADAAIHLLLWNGLDRPGVWDEDGTDLTLSFSFLGTVRMLDEISNPIAPVSYQPRLKVQLLRVLGPRGERGRMGALGALELLLAHDSNGQKGCALADHVRSIGDADFDCVPATDPPSTELNLVDGSFTRNFAGLGLWGKLLLFPAGGGAASLTLAGGATAEWNFACARGGCIEPEMRARYGEVILRWSVEADAVVIRNFRRSIPLLGTIGLDARLRASLSGSTHLGLAGGREPFGDLTAQVAYLPRYGRGSSVGPFLRYHRGADPLNIRFEERLDAWTVGVVFDPAPPAFRSGAEEFAASQPPRWRNSVPRPRK